MANKMKDLYRASLAILKNRKAFVHDGKLMFAIEATDLYEQIIKMRADDPGNRVRELAREGLEEPFKLTDATGGSIFE